MADEFNTTNTNWWDSSSRNRFDSSGSSSSTTNNTTASFGWPRSSLDSSASVSGTDHNLHMMGLGLASPSLDWNQALLRGDKSEGSYRSMLQENLNPTSSYRGFSLEQTQFSPHGGGGSPSDSTVTCQGLPSSFQMDSSGANLYGSKNFQGGGILLGSDNQNYHQYGAAAASNDTYGGINMNMNANMNNPSEVLLPYWTAASAAAAANNNNNNNKVPPFLRTSPPKQQPQHTHLQFSNNAPFWNASAAGSSINDVRSPNFFPSLQTPYAADTQSFDEKPKHHLSEVRDTSSTSVKKSGGSDQPTSKRAKNDPTASPLPAFKVRKEKMGDRITALQQLVSPFGKTDTASVLSEAIEYIKFLHDQVAVLSTPYMKTGAPIPHQQNSEKAKESEGPKQDLRSRGLCLVPISSTFPVTHETTVDFWNPTFGGTFR